MSKLRILTGLNAGAQLVLEQRPYLLGSDADACDVVLADEGVASRACALRCRSARHADIEVMAGGIVVANDIALAVGRHAVELPAHLLVSGVELLLAAGAAQESSRQAGAAPQGIPAAAQGTRRWHAYGTGGLAVMLATGLLLFQGAIGSASPSSDPAVQAGKILRELGHADLSVRLMPSGQLQVTGYARSLDEVQRIRDALRPVVPPDRLSVRVAHGGAAAQFAASSPQPRTQALGTGAILIDAASDGPAVPDRPPASVVLRLRAWQAGEQGYIEVASGRRYELGTELPGGYTLVAVDGDSITVRREGDEQRIALRSAGS